MRIRLAAAGALSLVIGVGGVAAASQPPAPPIKVHLALPTDRVEAGKPMKATVLLNNTTSRTITVNTCAENGWLQVGLKGHRYTYVASSLLIVCPASIHLGPGNNRFAVTVLTTYESGGGTAWQKGPPALPAGKYSTVVSIMGLEHLTSTPNRLVVALAPPG